MRKKSGKSRANAIGWHDSGKPEETRARPVLHSRLRPSTGSGLLMRFFGFAILSVVSAGFVWPAATTSALDPVRFEPNVGQTDASVKFLGRAPRATLWFTPQSVTLSLHRKSESAVLKMHFDGAAADPRIEGEGRGTAVSNYLLGNDPTRWRTAVPQFGSVRYRNLYPGTDAVFYGNSGKLEYDFMLRPGADPSKIRIAFEGVDSLALNQQGELVMKTGDIEIRNRRPRVYQGARPVDGHYVLLGKHTAGFAVDEYDRTRPLVIDPVLSYATFLGGSGGDYGFAMASDSQGNLYVTGGTDSPNFPVTAGLTTATPGTAGMAFVSKINPSASGAASLIFSTYLGGLIAANDLDYGQGIAVDSNSNVIVAGVTYSTDFPLSNAFQTKLGAGAPLTCGNSICPDGFITKLSPAGNSIVYSSYVGGSDYDAPYALAVDGAGTAYLTGITYSSNFPAPATAYQRGLVGQFNAFLTVVSPTGGLNYSSYFGQLGEECFSIAVDNAGVVYMAGDTTSLSLPVTSGAFQSNPPATASGQYSGFVVKLQPAISGAAGLQYSSYLGGTGGLTTVWAINTDGTGKIYATGATDSAAFPVSASAYQAAFAGEVNDKTFATPGDAFVTILDPSAQGSAQLVYSTYLGGSFDDEGFSIATDSLGRITIAGNTDSCDFPTSTDALQPQFQFCQTKGSEIGFIARLDPTQFGPAGLVYSSFVGGSVADTIFGMTMDSSGNHVAVAGETFSPDAPVTVSAFQPSYGGSDGTDGDAYVAVFDFTPVVSSIPDLTIGLSASGTFTQGQTGATYTITVQNVAGAPTNTTVMVTDTLPAGLTATSIAGTGWTCTQPAGPCTRTDALAAGASYPPIVLTVSVGGNTAASVTNTAAVSGGGETNTSNDTASNITTVAALLGPVLLSPANGATGTSLTPVLMWNAAAGASSYDVFFGASSNPPLVTNTVSTSYNPGTLNSNSTYFWRIVAKNSAESAPSAIFSFSTGPLGFVPVTPCRIADTRNANGAFGGPSLAAQGTRNFAIPSSACNIPASATAYSLNIAVVPRGLLGFLTVWPAGQVRPVVATLNSIDGRIKSNAAIVPAGAGGSISVFATDATDVIIDINGYFVPSNNPSALAFYPITPCRIADTRNATAPLGGPSLAAQSTRTFPVQQSACGVPTSAQAYALNFAAVPNGALGFLTAWPTGQPRPLVASLNDPTGTVAANAVVVPAGNNGSVDVFTTDNTDLVIDMNGYFAPPGPGGLSLYNLSPCRVLDTRLPAGSLPFSGSRDVNVVGSPCNVPATAQAYIFSATVVPPGPLGFLTLWPQGPARPLAATLNASDGAVTNNMAIIPTTNGAISAFATDLTHLVLDIFAYFAP
jgi:uncharacterized repeat protein (TIGR01451 family)